MNSIHFSPRWFLVQVTLLLGLLSASTAFAQTVPALVNYQGRLANPDGTPLATGDYQLTFRVYDSATNSGGLIWGPQVFDGVAGQGHGGKIPVVQGYFNVMLGPVDTNGVSLANAFNATNRYVEITVSNRPPILPRQQILSTPFAFNSAKLAGADWSAVFGTNDPVNGRIPTSKLVTNGAILAQSVGIRVNNPAVPLDVLGRTRQRGDNGSESAGTFLFDTATGTDRAFVGMNGNGHVGLFGSAGGGWGLNMNVTNGNVGIGTLNPVNRLHVQGPGGGTTANFEASPGVNTIKFLSHNEGANYGSVLQFTDGSTDSASIRSVANGGLRLATAGAERVTVDNSGNVGIGTTSPQYKLDVTGDIRATSVARIGGLELGESLTAGQLSVIDFHLGGTGQDFNARLINSGNNILLAAAPTAGALTFLVDGSVGIGTSSPARKLDVNGDIGASAVYAASFNAGTGNFAQDGIELGNSAGNSSTTPFIDLHYGILSNQDYNIRIINNGDGVLSIFKGGVGTARAVFNASGLTVNGTFVSSSDRNSKESIESINARELLDKVASLPITRWNYKDDRGSRHIGPMAQDFFAAFGIGPDEKHITSVDADGVALAAIQGLNQKLEEKLKEKDAEIEQLTAKAARIDSLEERLLALERAAKDRNEPN